MYAAIKELMHGENHEKMNVKSPWAKQIEVIKEPHVCAFLRDLLLYSPGKSFLRLLACASYILAASLY